MKKIVHLIIFLFLEVLTRQDIANFHSLNTIIRKFDYRILYLCSNQLKITKTLITKHPILKRSWGKKWLLGMNLLFWETFILHSFACLWSAHNQIDLKILLGYLGIERWLNLTTWREREQTFKSWVFIFLIILFYTFQTTDAFYVLNVLCFHTQKY